MLMRKVVVIMAIVCLHSVSALLGNMLVLTLEVCVLSVPGATLLSDKGFIRAMESTLHRSWEQSRNFNPRDLDVETQSCRVGSI